VAPKANQTVCDDCVPGKYQSAAGQEECVDCPEGSSTEEAGRPSCSDCPGERFALTGSSVCDLCNKVYDVHVHMQ